MALNDPSNYLPTTQGYATPAQIQQMYEYANLLQKNAVEKPVAHWTQGVSNMVNALVGGYQGYQADEKQRLALNARSGSQMPGLPDMTPKGEGAPKHASREGAPDEAMLGGDPKNIYSAPDRDANAISSLESGGNYHSLGPVIPKSGDRAYGKYQVMGANIGPWTKEVLGQEMTPQEFLKNSRAQDLVFNSKFGAYRDKYGPEGAARAWFAGEGGMNNPNARDVLGTTVASYAQKFNNARGGGAPSAALAFDGTPNQSDAQSVIAQAINPRARAAPTPVAPPQAATTAPPAPGGPGEWDPQPIIPPGAVPQRPRYTRQQVQEGLRNPALSEAERKALVDNYMSQYQPMQMPVTGGVVWINPLNPSQQKFVPSLEKATSKYGEGIELPTPYITGPYGGAQRVPIQTAPAPPRAPIPTPPVAPPAAPVVPGRSGALIPPVAPPEGGVPPAAAEPNVKMAALPPDAGIASDAGPPGLTAPPVVEAQNGANVPPMIPSEPPPLPAGEKTAQLKGIPGIPQADFDIIKGFKDLAVEQEGKKETSKKMAEQYAKRYEDMTQAAQKAQQEIPLLHMAQKIVEDPQFYSGIGNDAVLMWNRAKGAVGEIFGDKSFKESAAPQEVFGKLVAGSILDGMKAYLQGLGQVRVAEIQLLKQASASPMNTRAANRALLEVTTRSQQRLADLNAMAQDYISGSEVVNPNDPKEVIRPANVGATGEIEARGGLDVGWDKLVRDYYKKHPSFSPEEIENYTKIWEDPKNQKPAEEPKAGAKGEPVRVNSPDEAQKLAPGTPYITPDNQRFTR